MRDGNGRGLLPAHCCIAPWQVGADSGSSKYNKAKELKTPLVDEAGLFAMIAATPAAAPREAVPVAPAPAPPVRAPQAPSEAGPSGSHKPQRAAGAGCRAAIAGQCCKHAAPSLTRRMSAGVPPENQLWVEKHKPTSIAQLVGNGKLIADLRMWLNEWQR
jgi:replication factor C subunit 1